MDRIYLYGVLQNFLQKFCKKFCHHQFAIQDLRLTGSEDESERVEWACAKCGKVFRASHGLAIAPDNGVIFRR